MAQDNSTHVVASSQDMLLGDDSKYRPWSQSRMDTALTCLNKFYKVYMEGTKETSPALTLGGLSHEIIANLLKDGHPSLEKAEIFLAQAYSLYRDDDVGGAALAEVRAMFPYMIEFTKRWKAFLKEKGIKKDRVEVPYGLTEDLTRAHHLFKPGGDVFLRGIIDLWAYDSATKTLYIVDHKTNKHAKSANAVKEDLQLQLYVGFLTAVYRMPWTKAYYALNFLRKGKLVWASTDPIENGHFMAKYRNTLQYLETCLFQCENDMVWPATKSFKCRMCSFRNTCSTYNAVV